LIQVLINLMERRRGERTVIDWPAVDRFVRNQQLITEELIEEAGGFVGGYRLSSKVQSIRVADQLTLMEEGISLPPNLDYTTMNRYPYIQVNAGRDYSYDSSDLVELGDFIAKLAETCDLKPFTWAREDPDHPEDEPSHFFYQLTPDLDKFKKP
jgi:hypothetical protein